MDYKKELVSVILDATQYNGSKEPHSKTLSASSYDLEPMQLYLKWEYGDTARDEDFTGATLGTVAQLGFDNIFGSREGYSVAQRRTKTLSNGWEISGETDLLDHVNKAIVDFKVLSGGGYKTAIAKESYIPNMSIYRWLFDNEFPKSYLFVINKAGSNVRNNQYELVDLTDRLWDYESVEQILLDKTNEIQYMIDNVEEIPECDVFQYGRDKEKFPNKCRYYCSFKDNCKYYQKRLGKANYFAMEKLL